MGSLWLLVYGFRLMSLHLLGSPLAMSIILYQKGSWQGMPFGLSLSQRYDNPMGLAKRPNGAERLQEQVV